jgi:hypothetical protein
LELFGSIVELRIYLEFGEYGDRKLNSDTSAPFTIYEYFLLEGYTDVIGVNPLSDDLKVIPVD